MKKDVTYYLEDISRLKEISKSELDEWVAEMPFHQPLQMLAGLKSEMEGHATDDDPKVYAAYFVEDFESIATGKKKKKIKKEAPTTKAIDEVSTETDTLEEASGLGVISSQLADDALEDSVIDEMMEKEMTSESQGLKVVSSQLADDLLEEEVIQEVMEEKTEIEIPSESKTLIETIDIEEEAPIPSIDAEPDNEVALDEELVIDDKKVDYSEYTDITPKKKKKKKKKKRLDQEFTTESTSISLDDGNVSDLLEEEESAPKAKKKKKVKNKVNKKKKAKKSKAQKKQPIDKIEKEKPKKKKKTSKAKDKSKDVSAPVADQKSKKKKGKKKKKTDKVQYVIVDSATERNFKLKDYEGVSSYTSWLLEQESINDTGSAKKLKTEAMKKTKKKKKKKKKLKIAQDSVKKQDYIISEPLANILAMQGHTKKAKKMYEKLAKVFPEKEAYFVEKINSLKK